MDVKIFPFVILSHLSWAVYLFRHYFPVLSLNLHFIAVPEVPFMQIKPSASIRQNYNEIAALCKSTGEPIYLTKNGEGDLVVMDIDAFVRREKMLKLRENCWWSRKIESPGAKA